jgi:hypothetical protein
MELLSDGKLALVMTVTAFMTIAVKLYYIEKKKKNS